MSTMVKMTEPGVQKPDRLEIEAFLLKDLIWSSEVIFTLEEEAENIAEWYVVKQRDRIETAMMMCPEYRPVPIFLSGNVLGAPQLLDKVNRHREIFLECPLDFVPQRFQFAKHVSVQGYHCYILLLKLFA